MYFQVVDNHVINYIPAENIKSVNKNKIRTEKSQKLGALLVGAESADPQKVC